MSLPATFDRIGAIAASLRAESGSAEMDLAYVWYETARAMLTPARLAADAARHSLGNPGNPLAYGPYARSTAAALRAKAPAAFGRAFSL